MKHPYAWLPLFRDLDLQEAQLLEGLMTRRSLRSGELLFSEGSSSDACYLLLSGRIGVYKRLRTGQLERLVSLERGTLLGHMALVDSGPRSASCRAEAPASLMVLHRETFDRLFHSQSLLSFKILDEVAQDLVSRLRAVTLRLAEGRERNWREEARETARLLAGAQGTV